MTRAICLSAWESPAGRTAALYQAEAGPYRVISLGGSGWRDKRFGTLSAARDFLARYLWTHRHETFGGWSRPRSFRLGHS